MTEIDILADNLKNLRKELHESQIEFAYNCGISSETISLIERKITSPNLDTLQKIATYTGKTVSKLLEIKEK